jgi:hypothetical protein
MMRGKVRKIGLIVLLVCVLVGVAVLLNATSLGNKAASSALRAQGGVMDTNKYNYIRDKTCLSWTVFGSIGFGLGGLGLLLLGYVYYKELES